jgi:hypothetical protein
MIVPYIVNIDFSLLPFLIVITGKGQINQSAVGAPDLPMCLLYVIWLIFDVLAARFFFALG